MVHDTETFRTFLGMLPETPDHPCSYFANRTSRLQGFLTGASISQVFTDVLNRCGFRRCGEFFYRPACRGCRACVSYRIPVHSFCLSRSQKRVIARNRGLEMNVDFPRVTPEKEEIYLRYQYAQHFRKPMPGLGQDTFDRAKNLEIMHQQMYTNTGSSLEFEIRQGRRVVGFVVTDAGKTSLSAVYSVYDPDEAHRSLGSQIILSIIKWARENGLSEVYLGHYIAGHPKMDYKGRFQPAQILDPDTEEWNPFNSQGSVEKAGSES